MDKLIKEKINPSLGFMIRSSRCTGCNLDYKDCDCSKLLDETVSQEILDASPFPFWTDRSTLQPI